MEQWFDHPELLWLLAALLPFALWDGLRRWGGSRARQLVSVGLRVLLLAGIIAALAGPHLKTEEKTAKVVFVVDRSASIPDALLEDALTKVEEIRTQLESDEEAGLVLFDDRPEVLVYPGEDWTPPTQARGQPVDQTDVGAALQVALGLIPEGERGRIVLFTDARETQGSTRAAVNSARARQIPIWTVPIRPEHADPAVTAIDLDRSSLRPGETLTGEAVLRGGPRDSTGRLVITLGDEVLYDESYTVRANGTHRVAFEHALDEATEPGLATVRAVFTPDPGEYDLQPANNQLSAGVDVTEPPRVLLLANNIEEVENLGQALQAELMTVDSVATAELAERAGEVDLDQYDLVFLGNVPMVPTEEGEPFMPEEMAERLRRYVSAGGGLVVLGGDRAYELGGYGGTAVGDVLPIDLQPRDPEIEPAVTMMIILDNSGSMGSWAEGGTKMDLANQAAVAAMRLLRPFDYLGVMAVDDRVDWVVPIQQVSNRERIERSIRGIMAGGGGIYVYTSMREAYRQMRSVSTPLRHVIVFSDAADSEEQVSGVIFGWGPGPNCYDLARSMQSEGITVSVIGIGYEHDQDTQFLRTLAREGGGRFYLTSRASELQTLFVEETERLVDSILREEPFRVRAQLEHPTIEGLEFRRSPRLSGHVELEARETAEVILTGPSDDPVMTVWQYGLGQVVAMATDAGPRWSSRWLDWDGYPIFWTQTARWAMRRHEGDETAVEVDFSEAVPALRVARRTYEGLTEIEGGMHATLVETDEAGQPISGARPVGLRIVEPGLWEAELSTQPGRRYLVRVVDAGGQEYAEQSFVAPPSREFRYEDADDRTLREIAEQTGASFEPERAEIGGPLTTVAQYQPIWLYLLCGALLMMPLDAFLRRPGRDV